MEYRISATELARKLGDVLGNVRYRGDSFVVERSGDPVARLGPLPGPRASLREAFAAWAASGAPDPDFADILERVEAADHPPDDAWGS
jgi:antitoxin (DNA-binding transcriptional repressor) of toxin-antitoxin stability system